MSEMNLLLRENHRYRTNPDFVLRRIAGEGVLVPTGNTQLGNSMITVNETFSYLWELFTEPIAFAEAVRRAREDYDDSAGEIEAHIEAFIRDCVKYGMMIEED